MKTITLNPGKQKKRLRWILLLFFIVLSLPVYYLLQTVYTQLENEAYFNARHQAEKLVDQIERNLQQLLESEQNRPIAEYSFFNVLENPLLSESAGVKFSPLSEVPPKTDIKGLVGYFQINTDGSFHIPALPDLGQDNISGLSLAELESRLALKQQLRLLLSSKIPQQKDSKLKQATNRTQAISQMFKADSVAKKQQSYIEEFKQDKIIKAENMSSTIKALEIKKSSPDFQIYTDDISKNESPQTLSKSAKKYRTRKEIVQLPDQTMASSYFNKPKQQAKFAIPEQESIDTTNKINTFGTIKPADSSINIFSFESEVTPLQLLLIGQDYFCFYRYVWHDNNRYTQGFIVKNNDFLMAVTHPLLNSGEFNNVLFYNQNHLLFSINHSPSRQEFKLYSRQLSVPFQNLELIVNAAMLADVPGGLLIDLIALSIYGIFFIGFTFFYRLGSRQIDLAKQQQNFISAVSHELKTPLTSIRMYGEMLRSGWITDETKKQNYYDFIFFESERLSRLIANVLQLARLGHQKQNTEIISTSAQSLLNRISSKVEAQIEASSFQLNILESSKTTAKIDIKVNEDAFIQIVINLVDNAIKFANKSNNKSIDIGFKISKNAKYVNFYIRDYGPGIKKDQLKKIFQLFYRSGDELTRTTPGTGIGLALVAQLADSMHASINVVNKSPGTEFQIQLPTIKN